MPDKPTNAMDIPSTKHLISANLMLEAAKLEYQAACFVDDPQRVGQAHEKVVDAIRAWCDATYSNTKDTIKATRG